MNFLNLFQRTALHGTTEANWEALKVVLEAYKKPCWLPKTRTVSSSTVSNFMSEPILPQGEMFDFCPAPMQLLLQLRSQDLPAQFKGKLSNKYMQILSPASGLRHCEDTSNIHLGLSTKALVKLVDRPFCDTQLMSKKHHRESSVQEIIGWCEKEDYPDEHELDALGCHLNHQQRAMLSEAGYPRQGDKLGGWTKGLQGVEYPTCAMCSKPMSLIFQIDTHGHWPSSFVTNGKAYVTQCAEHSEQFAISFLP